MAGISRRKLLGGLGTGAGAIAATGLAPIRLDAEAAPVPAKKRQWVMVIDMRRCDGCTKCTQACQDTHHLPKSFEWIKVRKLQSKRGQQYFMRSSPASRWTRGSG